MSKAEIARFLITGNLTGKAALQSKRDGSPHMVPIWFVLDNENSSRGKIGNIIFTTGETFYPCYKE